MSRVTSKPVTMDDYSSNKVPFFECLLGLMFTVDRNSNSYIRYIAKDAGKHGLSLQKILVSFFYVLSKVREDQKWSIVAKS